MDLLPCPFCDPADSAESPPWFRELRRVDRAEFNKNGKRRKRVDIAHLVECGYCGAQGPSACDPLWSDDMLLTEAMVESSKAAAAFAWNSRAPINTKAYELVSSLITEALGKLSKGRKG